MIRFLVILLVSLGLQAVISSSRFDKIADPERESKPTMRRDEIFLAIGTANETGEEIERIVTRQGKNEFDETIDNISSESPSTSTSLGTAFKSTHVAVNTLSKSTTVIRSGNVGKIDSPARKSSPQKQPPQRNGKATTSKPGGEHNWVPWVVAVIIVAVSAVIATVLCYCIRREKRKRRDKVKQTAGGTKILGGSHISPSASRGSGTSPGNRKSGVEDSRDGTDSRDYGQPSVNMGLWAQRTVVEKSYKSPLGKTTKKAESLPEPIKRPAGMCTIASKLNRVESLQAKMPEPIPSDDQHGKNNHPPYTSPSVTASSSHGPS